MLDDDAAAARRSIILLDELDAPFEAARSQLVVAALIGGDAARPCLEDARRRFERLGSLPWIARCRTGTDARPDRQPQARPVIAALLTPAELRVAAAVGAGMSTREAAASLALSTRTIDAHLRSIFRKLHITSRSQLAVLVSEQTPFER
jgi:DNA-binding CsgD family transcriptional regulator